MKRFALIAVLMMVATLQSAMGAEDSKGTSSNSAQKSPDQSNPQGKSEKKKSPGTMEKAGNSAKSSWHKFTKSVKQGAKKPTCTPEQKTLKQC